jgi:aldose sugar dehydrogenase
MGTGHQRARSLLRRCNDRSLAHRREPMLRELGQRVRDIRQGPDGYLYVLTEENDAALIRIEPAN